MRELYEFLGDEESHACIHGASSKACKACGAGGRMGENCEGGHRKFGSCILSTRAEARFAKMKKTPLAVPAGTVSTTQARYAAQHLCPGARIPKVQSVILYFLTFPPFHERRCMLKLCQPGQTANKKHCIRTIALPSDPEHQLPGSHQRYSNLAKSQKPFLRIPRNFETCFAARTRL